MAPFKILCFPVPASGHTNPFLPILKELKTSCDVQIIVYSIFEFKSAIEATGAEFRPFLNFDIDKLLNVKPFNGKREFQSVGLVINSLQFTKCNLEYLAKEIDMEKPDLICYDVLGK